MSLLRISLLFLFIAALGTSGSQAQSCKEPVDCTLNPSCPACLPSPYNKTILDADKRFKENVQKIDPAANVEVINGEPTSFAPETVGFIGIGKTKATCTGVLIAPTVAVTARHCRKIVEPGATASFGASLDKPAQKIAIKDAAFMEPDRSAFMVIGKDVGIVLLERPATAKPVLIATRAQVKANAAMRVVGYGIREDNSYGVIKAMARVIIASHDCTGSVTIPATGKSRLDKDFYGCAKGEVVAVGRISRTNRMGADTCNGDSGGPAFVARADSAGSGTAFEGSFSTSGGYALAAVTSRAIGGDVDPRSTDFEPWCGQGGIYTRIDGDVLDWVIDAAAKWGVRINRPSEG